MLKRYIVRPLIVLLSYLAPAALVYLGTGVVGIIIAPLLWTSALAIAIDVIFIVTLLSCMVVARRGGYVKAAFLAAGILAGWLLALRFSGPLGVLLMPHGLYRLLATMALYWAVIALGAIGALRIYRRTRASGIQFGVGATGVRGAIGRLCVGVALGMIIWGAVIVSLSRVAFDGSTVESSWRVTTPEAMAGSAISPPYVRAARQMTAPVLTSHSFDIAMDGMDYEIRSIVNWWRAF